MRFLAKNVWMVDISNEFAYHKVPFISTKIEAQLIACVYFQPVLNTTFVFL